MDIGLYRLSCALHNAHHLKTAALYDSRSDKAAAVQINRSLGCQRAHGHRVGNISLVDRFIDLRGLLLNISKVGM